jgi:hypothetical protein
LYTGDSVEELILYIMGQKNKTKKGYNKWKSLNKKIKGDYLWKKRVEENTGRLFSRKNRRNKEVSEKEEQIDELHRQCGSRI